MKNREGCDGMIRVMKDTQRDDLSVINAESKGQGHEGTRKGMIWAESMRNQRDWVMRDTMPLRGNSLKNNKSCTRVTCTLIMLPFLLQAVDHTYKSKDK
jgi:hypothetical protein